MGNPLIPSRVETRCASEEAESRSLDGLIRRAQGGYREAFDGLLVRYESRALSIARQMGLGREDAQDVAQDAFLRLFRYIRKFRNGESFTNWFYRIVVHAVYDHLHHQQHGGVSLDGEARAQAEDLVDSSLLPQEALEVRQKRRQIQACLRSLAPKERAAFVLRDLQGLDTRTVARALRVSQVTVRRHASNARRKIRARLERQFPDLFEGDT